MDMPVVLGAVEAAFDHLGVLSEPLALHSCHFLAISANKREVLTELVRDLEHAFAMLCILCICLGVKRDGTDYPVLLCLSEDIGVEQGRDPDHEPVRDREGVTILVQTGMEKANVEVLKDLTSLRIVGEERLLGEIPLGLGDMEIPFNPVCNLFDFVQLIHIVIEVAIKKLELGLSELHVELRG